MQTYTKYTKQTSNSKNKLRYKIITATGADLQISLKYFANLFGSVYNVYYFHIQKHAGSGV